MRIRIKRRIRTSNSEQWSLYDSDELDNGNEPVNVGKMDIHYDPDTIYATLMLWSEFTEKLQDLTVETIINDLVEELVAPVGVPADYSLEFFTPSFDSYKYYTNIEEEEDEDLDDADEEEETPKGNVGWS